MHRGITARYVGLASNDNPNEPKSQPNPLNSATPPFIPVYSTSIDPTRSDHVDPFLLGNCSALAIDVQNESLLFYARQRDIHDASIVFMQMLMRLDMVTRFRTLNRPALPLAPDPLTFTFTSSNLLAEIHCIQRPLGHFIPPLFLVQCGRTDSPITVYLKI